MCGWVNERQGEGVGKERANHTTSSFALSSVLFGETECHNTLNRTTRGSTHQEQQITVWTPPWEHIVTRYSPL